MIQLTLSSDPSPRYGLSDLVVHAGIVEALSSIRSVLGSMERSPASMLLHGSAGTGKTHLLHVAASVVTARRGDAYGPALLLDASTEPTALGNLLTDPALDEESAKPVAAVAVDNVDTLPSEAAQDLWTIWNKLTRWNAPLLFTSRESPSGLFADNPHLRSRVAASVVLELQPPEDEARLRILDKMGKDRQLRLSADVCHYIVTHKSRNLRELERTLDELDQISLQRKKKINVQLIRALEKEGRI
ncbi:MAG: DnaA/Hda family protein [Thermodesulfobacteriota bacterium]